MNNILTPEIMTHMTEKYVHLDLISQEIKEAYLVEEDLVLNTIRGHVFINAKEWLEFRFIIRAYVQTVSKFQKWEELTLIKIVDGKLRIAFYGEIHCDLDSIRMCKTTLEEYLVANNTLPIIT